MIKNITAAQLKEWLDNKSAILIDVREPSEYSVEHIPGALPMPLATLTQSKLSQYANKKLVFQCRSGKRGGTACEKVSDMGLSSEAYNLEGGIMAWSQAGYDVQTSGKFFLPLDQQVQLTIGLCVFLGSILAYTVHPVFLLLTGFVGIGLTLAGLTGFCGLALLLAKMPWNQCNANTASFCQMKKPEVSP